MAAKWFNSLDTNSKVDSHNPNKTPDVPAQANPEQERSIETNLEETTFQPDSSLKDQLQSNAVKSNLTNVNPSFGSLCRIFVFQKANLPKISLDIT